MKELLDRWYAAAQQVSPVRIKGLDRLKLMQYIGEDRNFKAGAEIGVDRGRFSEYMLSVIPGLHLYCVDPWHWRLRGESRYQSTVARLASYSATIIRKTSVEASLDIPDESLDFVYIDGDHTFDFVMTDIILWSRKVRYGGIVAGHDLYSFTRAGVIPAVEAYTRQHNIVQWFATDERTPSWFWTRRPSFVDPLKEQD
jgi:hypothetical protein